MQLQEKRKSGENTLINIDDVLIVLNETHNESIQDLKYNHTLTVPRKHSGFLEIPEILIRIYDFDKNIGLDLSELYLILEYLISENKCKSEIIENKTKYSITYHGKILIENGGYQGDFYHKNFDKDRAVKNENRIVTWTIIASIIGILLLVVEIIRLCKELRK